VKVVPEPVDQEEPLFTEYCQEVAPEAREIVTVPSSLGEDGKVTEGAEGGVVSMVREAGEEELLVLPAVSMAVAVSE
tara:strand:- start:236 stop:466 length:231 start_codon:yes stop_codon:yes gene_type:complete